MGADINVYLVSCCALAQSCIYTGVELWPCKGKLNYMY